MRARRYSIQATRLLRREGYESYKRVTEWPLGLAVSFAGAYHGFVACSRIVVTSVILLAGAALLACAEAEKTPPASPTMTSLPSAPTAAARTPTVDSASPSPTTTAASGRERVLVTRVIDGDTVVIDGGARVRYIGIDTPEDTNTKECFGDRATERNLALVEGRFVELERDVSETDRFGRLLRYVWVDGLLVNEQLVAEGYAFASTYPPDVKHQQRFLNAQSAAREAGLGLWAVCVDDAPPPGDSDDCDPSYPDVCIPPPPPDLNCPDVPYFNIRVLPPDPHSLDGNTDGVGCVG